MQGFYFTGVESMDSNGSDKNLACLVRTNDIPIHKIQNELHKLCFTLPCFLTGTLPSSAFPTFFTTFEKSAAAQGRERRWP